MTREYKIGDKVWVKGEVCESYNPQVCRHYVALTDDTGEEALVPMAAEDLRPRVKRKKAASPWQPIETAPKDGTWIFVWSALRRPDEDSYPVAVARWAHGYMDSGAWGQAWRVDGSVDLGWYPDPTHWMPIPPLEVE